MQRITTASVTGQDLTGSSVDVLSIFAPPAGTAAYRLELQITNLDPAAVLRVTQEINGLTTDTDYELDGKQEILLRFEFFVNSTQSAIAVSVKDTATASDNVSWTYGVYRFDEQKIDQPSQFIPTSSTTPFFFKMSDSSLAAPDVKISKNGSAFASLSAGAQLSHVANGLWKITPTATDTSTEGPLIVRSIITTNATTPASVYTETQFAYHFVFTDPNIAEQVDEILQDDFADINTEAGFNRSGPGNVEWIATVNDADANPIEGARVWVTTDAAGEQTIAGFLATDDAGKCTFLLYTGVQYYLWARKAGKMQIKGDPFTVED